ncbi:anti-sigma factor family protein [Longimicrobium sp.]|uniref:anti-sigma factor family protein n=1 Tax=Longimicrobium sp. TaxID=2029185 RepID=UPI002E34CFD1|nr:zf-HC2 domain-containing protein [Longimicrobium sp.]HEX6040063.1 zf-HC2 domain-containing protein [Longimicrobium sp.]
MTLTLGSRPQHLEDADLVRYMDRQLDRAGNRRVELHLAVCADCSARLQSLQDRGRLVSSFLAELDTPPVADEQRALAMAAVQRARFRARPVWVSRPGLAAAAIVALLLTVTFGTPPGRAWVSAAVERLGGTVPGQAAPEAAIVLPAQEAAPPAAATPAARVEAEPPAAPRATPQPRTTRAVLPPGMSEAVSFSPAGNYVLLKIDSRQRAGVLTLWIKNSPRASAQVVAGLRAEALEPTADGLHLRNTSTSRADYTVEVPTRYRYIRLQIGDEPETVINVNRARRDWLWSLSLAGTGQ